MARLAAVGQKADRRRARAARQSATMPLSTGYLLLAGGLTQAAAAGYETSGPFEPFFFFLGLALASLLLLERSGRPYWTGSHGPVRKMGGALPWHLAR